ncbi:hypothetical protein AwErysi_03280 [Erysipelotrichaceae bacterium]|nr:hypothetical protein AwErysi_03280 [Erysipelotrichaceae bacterium]
MLEKLYVVKKVKQQVKNSNSVIGIREGVNNVYTNLSMLTQIYLKLLMKYLMIYKKGEH